MNDIIPKCNGKTILFMDNARIHHYKKLIKELEKYDNIQIIYNVPYCPQFNPVEHIIGIIKNYILRHNVKTKKHIEMFLKKAINKIKSKTYKNCFKNSLQKLSS